MRARLFPSRPVLFVSLAILAALLPAYCASLAHGSPNDFAAFWCAGRAVLERQDPYLDASLHTCEVSTGFVPPQLTIPAPYPPYSMPLFAAFALLPRSVALPVWYLTLLACALSMAAALRRLTNLSWTLMAAACGALVLVPTLWLGQAAPVAAMALCWGLVFVRDERPGYAAAAFAVAAILPNFAIAAWLATFAFIPRARLPLLFAGVILVALSIASIGFSGTLLYASVVLPAHANAEAAWSWQLGTVAALRGISPPLANVASLLIFGTAIAIGLAVGRKLCRRYGGRHWIVASATAFSVAGAPYMHGWDVAFALPLALLLLAEAPVTAVTAGAAVLVATPWQQLAQNGGVQIAIIVPLLLLVADSVTPEAIWTIVAVGAIALIALEMHHAAAPALGDVVHRLGDTMLPPNALADARWAAFTQATASTGPGLYVRLATYATLLLLIVAAILKSGAPLERNRER